MSQRVRGNSLLPEPYDGHHAESKVAVSEGFALVQCVTASFWGKARGWERRSTPRTLTELPEGASSEITYLCSSPSCSTSPIFWAMACRVSLLFFFYLAASLQKALFLP
ncbi:hypothetical protein KC349_g99 [Hortaea werneckii]|nr:hypothetical protein KC349_g99 [Hortaea werneckii]